MTKARPTCSVDECTAPVKTLASGLCSAHYQRFRTHGDPLAGRAGVGEARAYFLSHVQDITDDCMIWPHGTNGRYGMIWLEGKRRLVHVLACETWHGPMPQPGMLVCHGPCHNPLCWNGAHLTWGTYQGNSADKHRDGTINHGQRNGAAKLSPNDIREVRRLYSAGLSQTEIGRRLGVTQTPISKIIRGVTWSHIQ